MRGSLTDVKEESSSFKTHLTAKHLALRAQTFLLVMGRPRLYLGAPWHPSAEQQGMSSLLLVDMGSTAGSRRSRAQHWLLHSSGLCSSAVVCLCWSLRTQHSSVASAQPAWALSQEAQWALTQPCGL